MTADRRNGVPRGEFVNHIPGSPPDGGENVNQEIQKSRDSGDSPRFSESHRAGGDPSLDEDFEKAEELRRYLEKPFPSYAALAVDEYNRRRRAGFFRQWQAAGCFYFIRLIKGHPATTGADGPLVFKELSLLMRRWARKAGVRKDKDPWEHWLGIAAVDAEAEFVDTWDKVRYLPGQDPLDVALEHARRAPLDARTDGRKWTNQYDLFVSVAGWLQVAMGNRPILLPVELLAAKLGVKPMTISRFRKWAIADGYMKEVAKSSRRRAAEFVFDVSQWDCLEQAAQRGTAARFESR